MKTNDYGIFNLVPFNRAIGAKHVEALKRSINKWGTGGRKIICVKLKLFDKKYLLYIIDGQHFFQALTTLNLPIEYEVNEIITSKEQLVEYISDLNSSSKAWITADYVKAWSYFNPSYLSLIELFNSYNITYVDLVSVCMNTGRTKAKSHILKGRFKITYVDYKTVLDYLDDIFGYISVSHRGLKRVIIKVFMMTYNKINYSHEEVLKRVRGNIDKVGLITSETEREEFLKLEVFF